MIKKSSNKKKYVSRAERICKQAVLNDNPMALENAAKSGVVIRTVRIEGLTLLEYAVLNNSIRIIKWIVRNYRELMFANELVFACSSDNLEAAEILIAANDDINRLGYAGTALSMATQEGNIRLVKKLLEHNADIWRFNEYTLAPIYIASAEGHEDIVNVLLEHITVTEKSTLSPTSRQILAEALIIAGTNNNLSIVKKLVEFGVDINSRDMDGRPLLFYALIYEIKSLLTYLSEQNCDVDMFDAHGISVKRMLCEKSYCTFVKKAVLSGVL